MRRAGEDLPVTFSVRFDEAERGGAGDDQAAGGRTGNAAHGGSHGRAREGGCAQGSVSDVSQHQPGQCTGDPADDPADDRTRSHETTRGRGVRGDGRGDRPRDDLLSLHEGRELRQVGNGSDAEPRQDAPDAGVTDRRTFGEDVSSSRTARPRTDRSR